MEKQTTMVHGENEEKKENTSDIRSGRKFRKVAGPITSKTRLRILQQALHDYGAALTFNDTSHDGKKRLIVVLPGVHLDEQGNMVFVDDTESKE